MKDLTPEQLLKLEETENVYKLDDIEDRTASLINDTELFDEVETEVFQNAPSNKIIKEFDENMENCFIIYQLMDNDYTSRFRFEGSTYLDRNSINIDSINYNAIYTASLPEFLQSYPIDAITNHIYTKFNMDIPEDFKGHSLSVGDVIALKTDGNVSYHFVDSFGFREVPFINSDLTAIDKDKILTDEKSEFTSFFEDVKSNPENLFFALIKDQKALENLKTVIAINELHEQLEKNHPYGELEDLHSYCHNIWLKSDTASYEHIANFVVSAINENKITAFDLKQVGRRDFLYAFDMEDTNLLCENNPLEATEISMEENYNKIDGVINNLPKRKEQSEKPSILKALKNNATSTDKSTDKKQNEINR